jgi:hypothetical protein
MMISTSEPGSTAMPPVPSDPTLWASMPIAVGTADISGIAVQLHRGFRVTGRVEFEGNAERPAPDVISRMSVRLEPADGRVLPGRFVPSGRVDSDGKFTTYGLPAGKYFLRGAGGGQPWTFKAAMLEGRDVSDTPLDLQGDISGVTFVLTDRPTELTGSVTSASGGRPEAVVIAFPADSQSWLSYTVNTARIRAVSVDRTGAFRFAGLPAGDYYVVAVPDSAATDWRDPRVLTSLTRAATRVRLDDGARHSQQLRMQEAR